MVRLRLLVAVAVIGGALAIAYFGFDLFDSPSKDNPESVTLVLFDLSRTTYAPGEGRREYLQIFERVLDGVPSGSQIVADIIDDNPLAHATQPIRAFFPT